MKNWRALAWASGFAAVAVAAIVGVRSSRVSPLAGLAEAVGPQRVVEPRLSGGFRYAPTARTRAATSLYVLPAEVRIALGHLEKRAAESPAPHAMAELGVAYLISGDAARAVSS